MFSRPRAMASTRSWNTGTCATSSAPTVCRAPGIKYASSSTARWFVVVLEGTVDVVIDGKVVYRDAYYEEYQLAVELDGRLAHPEDERWRDSQRDNQASARGVETRRYSWRDVYAHPCETALLQAQILRGRGWPGTPKPCSAGCPVGATFSRRRGA